MPRYHLALTATCLLLTASAAQALEPVPFRVANLSPPALAHPLAIAESARLLEDGGVSVALHLDLASNATTSNHRGEHVTLDGETLGATLAVRYGLGERLQLGLDVPWVRHDRGSLDGFISDWHDFFGLPNGDRDDLRDDRLAIRYRRDGHDRLAVDRATDGIGDIRLLLGWQLRETLRTAVALQAAVKAPTGSADRLTGSGGWDLSLAVAVDHRLETRHGPATVWAGLGGSRIDGDVLAGRAEDWAANAWLGAGWSPLEWLALKLQLDAHSALYDSGLPELGDPALILTMGGSLRVGDATQLDIGVGEDLAVNASPDVTFHLGLRHRF